MLKSLNLNYDEKLIISDLCFLTLKPTMYVANINEKKESFHFLNQLKKIAKKAVFLSKKRKERLKEKVEVEILPAPRYNSPPRNKSLPFLKV